MAPRPKAGPLAAIARTMNEDVKNSEGWRRYFELTFALTKKYSRIDLGRHGSADLEKYLPIDRNDKTEIHVGYLGDELIHLMFINPEVPGFNKQQEQEYFYRYDFTPGESYGGPGLEFLDHNIEAIDKELKNGLKGREVQFWKSGRLIKSRVYPFDDHQDESYYTTICFEKRSFWEKVIDLFREKRTDDSFTTTEIHLGNLFGGI